MAGMTEEHRHPPDQGFFDRWWSGFADLPFEPQEIGATSAGERPVETVDVGNTLGSGRSSRRGQIRWDDW